MFFKEIKRMKKLNTIIITVLLMVMSSNINAQTDINFDESKSSPFTLRVHASPLLPFMFTALKSDTYSNEIKSGLGTNIGADFVYYIYTKENLRASVSFGLAYSNYRSSYFSTYENSISTTDIDSDQVLITETVTNMYEKQNVNFLDIPIKFGLEFELSEKTLVYMSVGATYGLNLKSTYSNEATINRIGYYPAFNVHIYDVDVNGSPYFYPNNKNMMTKDELNVNNNFSFEWSVGFAKKVNDKLSLMFGFKYMHGFSDIIEGNNISIVKHDESYNYSLNSLSERGDVIKTRGFGFEVGAQYNLWK